MSATTRIAVSFPGVDLGADLVIDPVVDPVVGDRGDDGDRDALSFIREKDGDAIKEAVPSPMAFVSLAAPMKYTTMMMMMRPLLNKDNRKARPRSAKVMLMAADTAENVATRATVRPPRLDPALASFFVRLAIWTHLLGRATGGGNKVGGQSK